MGEFNLIDKPWIPCINLEGKDVEYGIRDTLLKAHKLREICDDSPLVTVAIHRLLLAILYRAFNGPTEMVKWKNIYAKNSFDGSNEITSYLEKCYDRFFLFDDTYPFMQVANLDLNDYDKDGKIKKDKSDGLMRLVREAPDKGGRVLFDHRVGTERPEYEPKQIARMLLSAHLYSGTGIASGGVIGKQKIDPTPCKSAPCFDGLCLWFHMENLFQTLMINLVPTNSKQDDLPPWEDTGLITIAINSWKKQVAITGTIQRFTPLSRFIRVLDRRTMFFTNGLKTIDDADDPMMAYSRVNDTKPYEPIAIDKKKAAWRDVHSLLSIATNTRKPPASINHNARLFRDGILPKSVQLRANVAGLAKNRAKIFLWRHERLPLSSALLGNNTLIERLGALLQNAEQAAIALNSRIRRIVKLYLAPNSESPDGQQPDKDEVTKVVDSIDPRPAYWARLEKHFFDLLENLPGDWDEAVEYWKPDDQQKATRTWRVAIKQEAKRALRESIRSLGTTARAISAVARVRFNFNDIDLKPQPQKKKTKSAVKGGKKK